MIAAGLFRPARGALCLANRAISTSARINSEKIYELRTYAIKPKDFIDYMRLTYDHIGLRTNHSKLCGFWATELGGLNQAVHIWEYDNFAHRTEVRKALSQDEKWQSQYMAKMMPMLQRQENLIMKAVPWYEMQKFQSRGGIYELRAYTLKTGKSEQWAHRWLQGLPARCKYSAPVGVWMSEIGTLNQVIHLWQYDSADERVRIRQEAFKEEEWAETVRDCGEFVKKMTSKILIPTNFSPWK
ncbi:predicted protein [Nematostella vectensis]|uniref:NIPSNAP domain-containing protein n=1 Tax=Nematostella vectensis TaxID=45351 RepID=A7S6D8_NEMVE|nr:predicted protein [Nematostella vectensis]|eukprot:XP_001632795.1 predicted protein [Nematostella vectensis]